MSTALKSLRVDGRLAFVLRAMLYHSLSYVFVGLLASKVLDYQDALSQPVISDFMKPPQGGAVGLGPWLQPLRGLLFGLVLLPFRELLAQRPRGWLTLWSLFLVLGIVGTPAAAPSSLEGLIYSRLPLWYHLFGLPEVAVQTLVFSVLLHRSTLPTRARVLPQGLRQALSAVAGASYAFIGYAAVSIVFAFVLADGFRTEGAQSLRTLGVFAAPFVLNATLVALGRRLGGRPGWQVALLAWSLNTLVLLGYQALVLGEVGWVYVTLAPVLPALIIALVIHFEQRAQPSTSTYARLAGT